MSSPSAKEETSAGGVVVRCAVAGPEVLLILDRHRNWGFPKGHLEAGEAPEAAARREVIEETAVTDLTLHHPLGVIDWSFRLDGQRIHKSCHFFLFASLGDRATPQEDEGIADVRWCPVDEALEMLTHENAREILRAAVPLARRICLAGSSDAGRPAPDA